MQAQDHAKVQPEPPAYTPPVQIELGSQTESKPKRPVNHRHSKTYSAIPPSVTSSTGPPSLLRTLSTDKLAFGHPLGSPGLYSPPTEGSTGGILEQAWMNKMAREIARKVDEERRKGGPSSNRLSEEWEKVGRAEKGKRREYQAESVDGLSDAPPAYVV